MLYMQNDPNPNPSRPRDRERVTGNNNWYHPTSGVMQMLHFDWLRY